MPISSANHVIAFQYDFDRFTKQCNISNMPLNTLKCAHILLQVCHQFLIQLMWFPS